MFKHNLATAAVALAICAPVSGAWAQATQAGADTIRIGIKQWIGTRVATPQSDATFTFSAPISVVPDGTGYRATIPASTVSPKNDPSSKFEIGQIDVRLEPRADGAFDTTWTVPSEYRITGSAPEDGATITVASQRGTGVFVPAYAGFIQLDAALEGIRIAPIVPDPEVSAVTLAAITATTDSTEKTAGIFDTTTTVDFSDFAILDGQGAAFGSMKNIRLAGTGTDFNFAALATFSDAFSELLIRYGEQPEPPKEFFTELATLMASTPTLFDSLSGSYELTGLSVVPPEDFAVSLANASFDFGLDGIATDQATFRMGFAYDQLSVQPDPPYAGFMPKEVLVDLGLVDLPKTALMEIVTGFLQQAATMDPEMAAQMAAMQFQGALMSSQGRIEVTAIKAYSDLTTFDMTGEIRPDAAAPFMMTADAVLVIGGFDEALAALQEMPEAQDVVSMLTLLQTMGAESTDARGNPARRYELKVTQDGKVLLNGSDLMPLMDQMMQ